VLDSIRSHVRRFKLQGPRIGAYPSVHQMVLTLEHAGFIKWTRASRAASSFWSNNGRYFARCGRPVPDVKHSKRDGARRSWGET
jgi:hypothetical protein